MLGRTAQEYYLMWVCRLGLISRSQTTPLWRITLRWLRFAKSVCQSCAAAEFFGNPDIVGIGVRRKATYESFSANM